MKYRKKPVVIEALELRWDNWNEMCEFADVGKLSDGKPQGTYVDAEGNQTDSATNTIGLLIPTKEGLMLGRQGDWIIRGLQGELYPCKPDIFEATYETA
jgi:hypothetical protein